MEELLESLGILGAGEFIGRSPGRGLIGSPGLKGRPRLSEVDNILPSELERWCLEVGLRTPANEAGAGNRPDSTPCMRGGERLLIPVGIETC